VAEEANDSEIPPVIRKLIDAITETFKAGARLLNARAKSQENISNDNTR
jgi:hypothetical protein